MSSDFWFYLHAFLVTLSHFLVLILLVSTLVNFVKSSASFLDRGRRFAIVFFIAVFGINHVTNANSKCILTTLENEALQREGKPAVGDFLPRYYRAMRFW